MLALPTAFNRHPACLLVKWVLVELHFATELQMSSFREHYLACKKQGQTRTMKDMFTQYVLPKTILYLVTIMFVCDPYKNNASFTVRPDKHVHAAWRKVNDRRVLFIVCHVQIRQPDLRNKSNGIL